MLSKFLNILLYGIILVILLKDYDCFLFRKPTTTSTRITTNTTKKQTTKKPFSKNTTKTTALPILNKTIILPKTDNAYRVLRIADGDTIIANHVKDVKNKTEIKIRFKCVDAPEKTQEPWGPISTRALATVLPIGSLFYMQKNATDIYGRTLAELIDAKGININKKMLDDGMVVHYPFQSGCKEFQLLEQKAKQAKKGVWSDSKFELPWKYRERVGIGKIGVKKPSL